MANKYLFADLLLFTSGEGDEATSPSLAIENESIDASSSSLEVPIATYYMQDGCKRGRFHNGKQIPVCWSFILYSQRGRQSNVSLFCSWKRGNWGFQRIVGSAHCKFIARVWHCKRGHFSNGNQPPDCHWIFVFLRRWRAGNAAILHVDWCLQHIVVSTNFSLKAWHAFPTKVNTHLPLWARGPLWRPPSGHSFPSLHSIYLPLSGLIRVAAPFWIPSKIRPFPGSPSGSSPSARVSP